MFTKDFSHRIIFRINRCLSIYVEDRIQIHNLFTNTGLQVRVFFTVAFNNLTFPIHASRGKIGILLKVRFWRKGTGLILIVWDFISQKRCYQIRSFLTSWCYTFKNAERSFPGHEGPAEFFPEHGGWYTVKSPPNILSWFFFWKR